MEPNIRATQEWQECHTVFTCQVIPLMFSDVNKANSVKAKAKAKAKASSFKAKASHSKAKVTSYDSHEG